MQKSQDVVSLGLFPVNEILDLIQMTEKRYSKKVDLLGYKVNVCSNRLQTFKTHGTTCVTCGRTGLFFSLEYHTHDKHGIKHPHLNLYALENGEPVLMTHDHIKPLSKGGADALENTQTMCSPCNEAKGDKWGQ